MSDCQNGITRIQLDHLLSVERRQCDRIGRGQGHKFRSQVFRPTHRLSHIVARKVVHVPQAKANLYSRHENFVNGRNHMSQTAFQILPIPIGGRLD